MYEWVFCIWLGLCVCGDMCCRLYASGLAWLKLVCGWRGLAAMGRKKAHAPPRVPVCGGRGGVRQRAEADEATVLQSQLAHYMVLGLVCACSCVLLDMRH